MLTKFWTISQGLTKIADKSRFPNVLTVNAAAIAIVIDSHMVKQC